MTHNAYSIVRQFEKRVAEFAGAPYAVAVDSGTAALFLSLVDSANTAWADNQTWVTVPYRTYPSVAMAILHAGFNIKFDNIDWKGIYQLEPLDIHDGAKQFYRNMYDSGYHCLSFHIKKHIDIGRGGMILLDNHYAVERLKRLRYDGRQEIALKDDHIEELGWNMYMTPEQAARGLMLMDTMQDRNGFLDQEEEYPNLYESHPVFKRYERAGRVICL